MVRDLGRVPTSAPVVEFDARPAYDFLISLSDDVLATNEDLLEADRAWLARSRAALRADARETREASDPAWYAGVTMLLVTRPEIRSAADLVAAIDSVDPGELLRLMFCDVSPEDLPQELIDAAASGDRDAIATLRARLGDTDGEHSQEHLVALLEEPEAWRDRLRALLEAWLVAFEPIEARVAAIELRDVELRSADQASLEPSELVERTTGGIRQGPEPGVRRIVLAPSYFARPYNFLFRAADWRLYCYPVADDALGDSDPLRPPVSTLRLYRALGDETRLRIVKLLAGRDWYLTEIATQLGLSKPTVSHHLAQLRAAGLVTVTQDGALIYYTLRRDRLAAAGSEISRFVGA